MKFDIEISNKLTNCYYHVNFIYWEASYEMVLETCIQMLNKATEFPFMTQGLWIYLSSYW